MPEFAPLFSDLGNVLPKNTNPLKDSQQADALANVTIGAAAGATATATRARVKHNSSLAADVGGKVLTETINPINRASTAGDVTLLKNKFVKKNAAFVFPRDLSGNGGPAFTRS